MYEDIVSLVIETARELGEDEIGISEDLTETTILFGKEGVLDSMGLVTLIIAVEQAIEDKYDKSVGLADEKAMSQARSPYRSVETLSRYAATELEQEDE